MGRPIRVEYPGAVYHITSRGNEQKAIFLSDADRDKFLTIMADYHDRYGILIYAYALMDNHYHLILETPRGNLLKVMHGLNGGYTGYFNRKHRRVGHLFQGRYKAIIVDKDEYLLSLSRYVHLNPVRAGLIRRPERYPWTSYGGYIGRKQKEWMEYTSVLSQFGRHHNKAAERYRDYIEEALKRDVDNPLQHLYGQMILGGKEFIHKVKGMLDGGKLSREIVARKRFERNVSLKTILNEVQKLTGVKEDQILERGIGKNSARRVALYLAQRYTGLTNDEIGRIFGGIHFSTVSKAAARLKEETTRDKKLASVVKELDRQFKA